MNGRFGSGSDRRHHFGQGGRRDLANAPREEFASAQITGCGCARGCPDGRSGAVLAADLDIYGKQSGSPYDDPRYADIYGQPPVGHAPPPPAYRPPPPPAYAPPPPYGYPPPTAIRRRRTGPTPMRHRAACRAT